MFCSVLSRNDIGNNYCVSVTRHFTCIYLLRTCIITISLRNARTAVGSRYCVQREKIISYNNGFARKYYTRRETLPHLSIAPTFALLSFVHNLKTRYSRTLREIKNSLNEEFLSGLFKIIRFVS